MSEWCSDVFCGKGLFIKVRAWPVGLIGSLSPLLWAGLWSWKGEIWTHPNAFRTGPGSCAVHSMFTNQGVYILPKVLIGNMADFGNVTIFHLQKFYISAKMHRIVTQLHDMPDFLQYIFW